MKIIGTDGARDSISSNFFSGARGYSCSFNVVCLLQVLLEIGADPRIHADDGAVPQQVCYEVL